MSTSGKILAAFLGLLVLLPGLCFLAFGVMFAFTKPDHYGFTRLAPQQFVIGAVLTVVAILIFRYIGKHGGKPPPK